jgi:hypothetical protein
LLAASPAPYPMTDLKLTFMGGLSRGDMIFHECS